MKQSLMGTWIETFNTPEQAWLLDEFLPQLNARKNLIAGLVQSNGAWDFSFADQVAYKAPHSEVVFRPMSDGNTPPQDHENLAWMYYLDEPEKLALKFKQKLNGRPYRVTFGCEPKFAGDTLTSYLNFSAKFAIACAEIDLKIAMWGLPGQSIDAYTPHPDDLRNGKWNFALETFGELGPIVERDMHGYTGPILGLGAYNDEYLVDPVKYRNLGDVNFKDPNHPEMRNMKNISNWYTWNELQQRKWQTRHAFRYMWMNHYAEEKGFKPSYYYLGESPHDFYGDDGALRNTWEMFKNIQGAPRIEEVAGINTIGKIVEWWFDKPFVEAEIEQLTWMGNMLANDPYCTGWLLYAITGKQGDQQMYNWIGHKDILKGMIGKNMVDRDVPPTQEPTIVIPQEPQVISNYVKVTNTGLRLRSQPNENSAWMLQFNTGFILKIAAPDTPEIVAPKIGKPGWVAVWVAQGITGYVSTQFVDFVQVEPELPTTDNWREQILDERQRKLVAFAELYAKDPFGDVAHNDKMTMAAMAARLDKKI